MRAGLAQHDEDGTLGHVQRCECLGHAQGGVGPAGPPGSHPGDVVDSVDDKGDRALRIALDGPVYAANEGVFVRGEEGRFPSITLGSASAIRQMRLPKTLSASTRSVRSVSASPR